MNTIPVRASSLSELLDCPARWEAKNILGMRMPSSPAAHLGTSIHASTAVFDQAVLDGSGITADEAAGAFVDSLHDTQAEVDWTDDDVNILKAEEIGLALHEKYCAEIAPTQQYTGVEILCQALPVEFDDITLLLTGTTDRVRKTDKGVGISDLKTGKTAVKADGTVDAAKHGAQLAVYELLVEQATGVTVDAPAQIVGMQTNSKARVGTAEVATARSVLLGSTDEKGILDHAAHILKHGVFWGNPRSMLCSEKYCPAYKSCKWRF